MAYRLQCRKCNHIYVAARSYYACPRALCEANRPTMLSEVVDTAIDVAVAYVVADAIGDLAGSALDSLLDW